MEQRENKDNIGLLLDLRKRTLRLDTDDTTDHDYVLFGNFDGLGIHAVEKWDKFAPNPDMDKQAIASSDYSDVKYSSTFVLKLLKPACLDASDFFDYSIWMNPASTADISGCPFFGMIVVSISGTLAEEKNTAKELTKFFADNISAKLKEHTDHFSGELSCGLFESLGYYDYVLLLRASVMSDIITLCNDIRMFKTDGGYRAVSTCYSILGFHNWKKGDVSKNIPDKYSKCFEKTDPKLESVDIELQLHGGKTVSSSSLVEKLNHKDLYPKEIHTFGSTDSVLTFENPDLGKLFEQYLSGGCLNPEKYHDDILSKKTTFRFTCDSKDSPESDPFSVSEWKGKWKCLWNALDDFEKLRNDCRKNQRLTTSLRQLVTNFIDMSSAGYAFELRRFLNPVFDFLRINIEKANDDIEKSKEAGNYIEYRHEWEQYELALQTFCDLVGGFLTDINLSEKYFFEDSQLRHPPLGSATKLVFFYNYFVNEVTHIMKKDNGSNYAFLVISGGCDTIGVINLFYYLPIVNDEQKLDEHCLLIIEIPERILYNVPVAMNALIHEVFHIVGDRKRDLRSKKMKNAVAEMLALYFVNFGISSTELWRDVKKQLPKNLPFFELKKRWDKTFESEKESTTERIKEKILQSYGSSGSKRVDSDFSRNIIDQMKKDFSDLLVPEFPDSIHQTGLKPIFAEVYDDIHGLQENILLDLEKKIKEKNPYITALGQMAKKIRSYEKWDYSSKIIDQDLFVELYKLFLFVSEDSHVLSNDEDDIMYQIEEFVDSSFEAVIEAFSDCMMIKFFNLHIEDYLAFICLISDGDVDDRLPLNMDNVLRIGCVYRCCFADPGKNHCSLSDNKKKEIKEKGAKGIYGVAVDGLTENIEKILSFGNEYQDMTNFFVHSNSYLREAVDQNYSLFFKNINKGDPLYPFIDFYQKWEKSVEQDQGIGKVYPEIFNFWLKCAKGKQNQRAGDLFGNLEQ